MTRKELTDLVCTKAHRTDAQTRAEVKEYIGARYRMLWDSRPWRDALGMMSVTATDQIVTLPGIVDRVMQARWGDNTTLLPLDLGVIFSVDPSAFDRSGDPVTFSLVAPSAVSAAPGGEAVSLSSSDSNASFQVSIRGVRGTNEVVETVTMNGTGTVASVNAYDEILSLSKESTTMDLTVKDSTTATILTLAASETSRQFQRVHFHVTPTESKSLLVLFKRRFRPLVTDSDATELTGIDNALIAASVADVLEAQRQYGKAQLKMQESGALAQTMVDLERHQSASGAQLIPWDAAMGPDATEYFDIP